MYQDGDVDPTQGQNLIPSLVLRLESFADLWHQGERMPFLS